MRFFQYFLIAAISVFSISSFADSLVDEPSISVTGTATLEVEPDQVLIKFQATALEAKSALAKQKVDLQVSTLLSSLQESGFASSSLKSASLYTNAEYGYQQDKRTLLGVRATRDLSYLLTDLNKVNQFLDIVLQAKIDSISDLQYGLQSPDKWQFKVREMAVDDSLLKANSLAHLYGAELGEVYSINYQNSYQRPLMMRAMQNESLNTTYQVKTIKLTDTVQTVFLLNQ